MDRAVQKCNYFLLYAVVDQRYGWISINYAFLWGHTLQRKILVILQTDFIVALISRHFIVKSSHFTGWRGMKQKEKLNLKIFKKIQSKLT